jgi:hypothetical protein
MFGFMSWISNHIDCFVSQSRGNRSVEEVCLCPHAFNGHDDGFWDKVGQAVGNLQELQTINISSAREYDDGTDVSIPDWGELARILSHVWQKVEVKLENTDPWDPWAIGEVQALTRALSHGHPTITSFDCCYRFPYESWDALFSALATLPALKSVWLGISEVQQSEESALAYP